MAESYVSAQRFRTLTVIPLTRLDVLEREHAGWLEANLEQRSRQIEDRLRHKYAIPFPSRHATVEGWIVALVQLDALVRIGVEPSDLLFATVEKKAELTEAQLNDASDPESARWNLPLRDSRDASGIVKGGPKSYSESSPYTWTDVQGGAYRGR